MDLSRLDPPHVTTSSDPRERIDDLLDGRVDRSDIDVRDFLLDPPPTAEALAQVERRRQLVRRASLAAAALLAIVFLAPWPGAEPPLAPSAPDTSAGDLPVMTTAGSSPSPASTAVRLDEPTPHAAQRPTRSRRAAGAAASRAGRVAPESSTRPEPTTSTAASPVAAPAPTSPRPTPSARPSPAPAPASGDAGAILAPVR